MELKRSEWPGLAIAAHPVDIKSLLSAYNNFSPLRPRLVPKITRSSSLVHVLLFYRCPFLRIVRTCIAGEASKTAKRSLVLYI